MAGPDRAVECDVLVIGGAGAGLSAALQARERGASVVVACKGKAGRSGNTVVAAAQFAVVVPFDGSEDSPEQHLQDTMEGGRGINDQRLVRLFADQGGRQVQKLEEWGVRFLRSRGELIRRRPPGHRHARGIVADGSPFPLAVSGLAITLPLRSTAERMGVHFLDDAPVVRLALQEGEVCGALALLPAQGQLLQIRARAVVVATGGAGRVYANTNNTRGVCGDSYGLLLRAGATLRDMEFVQYYPCQMARPVRAPISSAMFGDGAVLRNRQGERFMPLYDPVNQDMSTRDVMSQAMFYELQKGNGVDGQLFMDCTMVPDSVLQMKHFSLARDLRKGGLDPAREWIKVAPTTHFFMGGVEIDESCSTGVPGLFAAGEAVGGVHGANRLSGNALTEVAVFGSMAGQAAAGYAQGRKSLPEPALMELVAGAAEGGRDSLDEVRGELRRAMWNRASIVRSEASLRSALATVRECARAVERCPAVGVAEDARREETLLMCMTAEAVVLCALARQESRGAHFREDYPSADHRWLGSHRVQLVGESLQVEFAAKRP